MHNGSDNCMQAANSEFLTNKVKLSKHSNEITLFKVLMPIFLVTHFSYSKPGDKCNKMYIKRETLFTPIFWTLLFYVISLGNLCEFGVRRVECPHIYLFTRRLLRGTQHCICQFLHINSSASYPTVKQGLQAFLSVICFPCQNLVYKKQNRLPCLN